MEGLPQHPAATEKEERSVKKTIAEALEARGYTDLTDVQEAVGNPDVEGQDLLVSAQTGSGKTVGFGLAIAPRLLGDRDVFERADAPLALVIAPTRELALQVKRELAWLFEKAGAVLASTVGGMDMRDERRALARGAHVVVATPGRLRDHISRGSIDLSAIQAVVLDEADEMLDLGFREDLEFILESTPQDRQTLLFSATVPPAIAKLAKTYQSDAVRIATTTGARQHADIEYRAYAVAPRDGENAIINVLRFYEAPNAIVFCNTRAMVNRLTTRLSNRGFSVVALSGELSQGERTHALQAMRDGRARVCVATDVAARGIDLPNLDLVVHAELPSNQDTLLHRSGRTGRAGRKGVSVMIVPGAARKKAQRLLSWAKLSAEWGNAPSAADVAAKDDERMLANPEWLEPVAESDVTTAEKLTQRFSAEQIAAMYLRLYRQRHTAPEELSEAVEVPRKGERGQKERAPHEAFGPSTWFSLEGGKAAGALPGRILPMLCKLGDLTRDDIGAIRIQPGETLVELRDASVKRFLEAVGPEMTLEEGAKLTKLASKPKMGGGARRSDKPRDKPRGGSKYDPQDAPRRQRKPQRTGSADWREEEKPRAKKPKKGGKPPFKSKVERSADTQSDAPFERPKRPKNPENPIHPSAERQQPTEEGAEVRIKRGPKPPVGKPSSKKNKARKLAAAAGKAGTKAGRKASSAHKPKKPKGGKSADPQ